MDKIEEYYDNNSTLPNFYENNCGITNKHLFDSFIDIYKIMCDPLTIEQKIRPQQKKFRENIVDRDEKCIISNSIDTECQACHIVSVEDGGSYDVNNGLLLNACLHITFDKYLWSINPETLEIDICCNDKKIVGSIYNFYIQFLESNTKPNIQINEYMRTNLYKRWEKYIEHKKLIRDK